MCNVFIGCFNQLYSAIGVKAPDFQMLQLQCGSQVNPIAGYLTSPDNTMLFFYTAIWVNSLKTVFKFNFWSINKSIFIN